MSLYSVCNEVAIMFFKLFFFFFKACDLRILTIWGWKKIKNMIFM